MPTFVRSRSYAGTISSKEKTTTSILSFIVLSRSLFHQHHRYNKLCGSLRSFAHRLSILPAQDPFRTSMESQLLSKLYDIGVLNSQAKLSDVDNKLTVAAFCRRRLAVFMCMSKMAETVSAVSPSLQIFHSVNFTAVFRLPNLLSRVTSVSVPIPSPILPFLLPGPSLNQSPMRPLTPHPDIWKTLSPG